METIETIHRKFDYNDWANRRALDSLRAMASPSVRAVRAFAHLLLVEKLWHARLTGEVIKLPLEFFPELSLVECEALIKESQTGFVALLESLTEEKLDTVGDFKTLKGDAYQATWRDVLTHILNHSTYHRGQVSMAVREDGGVPNQTDYILFVRETGK